MKYIFPLLGMTIFFISIFLLTASSDENSNEQEPGLILTLQSQDPNNNITDSRQDRLLALYVPENNNPSPFINKGPFKAIWTGNLNLDSRLKLSFSLTGRGKVKFLLDNEVLLEAEGEDLSLFKSKEKRFRSGQHAIRFEYTSPAKGDAHIRLYWEGRDIFREPIPPKIFSHVKQHKGLQQGRLQRRGRQLVAAKRCTQCHQSETPFDANSMPELHMDSPDLTNIGDRLNEEWMAHWIRAPRKLRAQAHMPHLFEDNDKGPQDIAAYLASLSTNNHTAEPSTQQVTEGGHLFDSLGCISCHTLPDSESSDTKHQRIPLNNVKWKWKFSALKTFIKKPNTHYKWIRMPDFHLSDEEAESLASFIYNNSKPTSQSQSTYLGNVAKGKQLVQSKGCLNCHATKEKNAFKTFSLQEISKKNWAEKGCLTDEKFGFTSEEKEALQALNSQGLSSLRQHTLNEFSTRQFTALNCQACHSYDNRGSHWSLLATETLHLKTKEKHLAQNRPSLSWVGEKLHSSWTQQLLEGKLPYTLRPWLAARMPAFSTYGEKLSKGLAMEHGISPQTTKSLRQPITPDTAAIDHGEKIVTSAGCNACHAIADKKPIAQFESGAPNLKYAQQRLQKEYFLRWMLNPQRIDPATTMPKYSFKEEDQIKTPFPILGGDAEKQHQAVWQYLATLAKKNER